MLRWTGTLYPSVMANCAGRRGHQPVGCTHSSPSALPSSAGLTCSRVPAIYSICTCSASDGSAAEHVFHGQATADYIKSVLYISVQR